MFIEVLDVLFTNHENISKGILSLTKGYNYLVAKDNTDKVVCFILAAETGKVLLSKYLEDNNFDENNIKFDFEWMKFKSDRYKSISGKKICTLDKKLILFEDIKEIAKTKKVRRLKLNKLPKQGFNTYATY